LKTLTFIKWEFKSLTRLRVILPLVAFMFFTSYLGGELSGVVFVSGENVRLEDLASVLGKTGVVSIEGIYLALAFFSAILVPFSLTEELNTGILKYYLSLPISRFKVFSAKFLACYIVLNLTSLTAVYYKMFMTDPRNFFQFLAVSPFYMLQPCLMILLATLFTFSVSLYFSVVSVKAWHASLYSLFTLYSFYTVRLVNPRLRWYLPPYMFFPASTSMTGIFYIMFFSVFLTLSSCYIFVRRLEVA